MKKIAANVVFTLAGGYIYSKSGLSDARAQSATVLQALPQARLLGTARLTVWGFAVYDARLWVNPDFQSASYARSAFALELTYLRNFEGKAIAERSLQEIRRQGSVDDAQAARWLAALEAAIPDVRAGDRLLGVYQPASGVALWHNGVADASLGEPLLERRFMGIWLDPATSEPTLRLRLLGQSP